MTDKTPDPCGSDSSTELGECVRVIRQIMKFIKDHSPNGFEPTLAESRVDARLRQIERLFDGLCERVRLLTLEEEGDKTSSQPKKLQQRVEDFYK